MLCGCNVVVVPAAAATTKNKNGTLASAKLPTMGVDTLPPVSDATSPGGIKQELFATATACDENTLPLSYHHIVAAPAREDRDTPMQTRARRGSQMWGASSSSSDEERERSEFEDDLSELSELSDSDFTPDIEDELAPGESDVDCLEERKYILREHVLVKPRGSREWYRGVVVKIREPSLRDKRLRGSLYIVVFRRYRTNIRDAFSVLDGTIRPDTPALRAILLNS